MPGRAIRLRAAPALSLASALAAVPCLAGQPAGPAAVPLLGSPEAAALLGLDPAALEARLGPPALRRHDTPAEYWRYLDEDCALDLFLYPGAGGAPRVVHARFRPQGDAGDAAFCELPLGAPPAGMSSEDDAPAAPCCA